MIPQPPHKKEEAEDWLMSYADMITLLMAFFVMLISMSHFDPVRYEQVQGGLAKDIGKHDAAQPMQSLKTEMASAMKGLKVDDTQVSIGQDDRGLVLDLDAGTFFDSNSAVLKDQFLPALMKMAETLASEKYSAFQVEVQGGLAKDIGKRDNSTQPMQSLKTDMAQAMRGLKIDDTQVSIGTDDRGLVLDLDAGTFFDPNSAALKDQFLPALAKIAATLTSEKYSAFQVEIQGHTDDDKPTSPAFPTNWELSAARATAVVRMLIKDGVQPDRLGAVGYADTRPRVANRDVNNNPLPINQAINRRVSIHIYPR